ncbi:hypothetical protein EMCG_00650 [[Emmonsia] crescens]|uniref:Ecp2 effector protein domain-containing protein n=1 Tax=[Emmonsia] crescens TaxID=73230 RepID=A0A0G2IYV0_9EURO|nr:hypothetical protein EMCG_00650 [Emmonsia crescens UAMH 3008]
MKFLSLALASLAGLLTSTLAVPSPLPKPEMNAAETVPSIFDATEHKLSPRTIPECFDNPKHQWAADGRRPIGEVGKGYDLGNKNIYDVAKKFCYESAGHQFGKHYEWVGKDYWFKNAWKTFPIPFVPVSIQVLSYTKPGRIDGKLCTDLTTRLISECIAKGRPSKLDHFRGGEIRHNGWTYIIFCNADYCYGKAK